MLALATGQQSPNACLCAGLTFFVYATDRILVPFANEYTDKLAPYKEPRSEVIEDLPSLVGTLPIQKLLFLDTVERMDEVWRIMGGLQCQATL